MSVINMRTWFEFLGQKINFVVDIYRRTDIATECNTRPGFNMGIPLAAFPFANTSDSGYCLPPSTAKVVLLWGRAWVNINVKLPKLVAGLCSILRCWTKLHLEQSDLYFSWMTVFVMRSSTRSHNLTTSYLVLGMFWFIRIYESLFAVIILVWK